MLKEKFFENGGWTFSDQMQYIFQETNFLNWVLCGFVLLVGPFLVGLVFKGIKQFDYMGLLTGLLSAVMFSGFVLLNYNMFVIPSDLRNFLEANINKSEEIKIQNLNVSYPAFIENEKNLERRLFKRTKSNHFCCD